MQTNSPCIGSGRYGGDRGAIAYVTAIDNVPTLASDFELCPNYPNPFNASTTISYSLPRQLQVTLDIYDILGRKVQTLYNGRQEAGEHSLIWQANDFSSGTYFYKLTTDHFEGTQKMILLK